MKIGIVLDNEFDSDHRVKKQVRQLIKAKHEVFVICLDFGRQYNYYPDFEIIRIPINKTFKNFLVLLSTNFFFYEKFWSRKISKLITDYNLEAIHCHDLYMAKASKQGINLSKHTIKLTLDLHENYPAAINTYKWATKGWRKFVVNPKRWYKLEFEYLNYADYIITLSDSFSKDIIRRFPALKTKKIVTHPNLLDLSNFQKFEKEKTTIPFIKTKTTLIYFGVVAHRRGLLKILPWLEKVLKEEFKFQLLIIGPVDKADSNEFFNLLKLPKLSKVSTYVKWADIAELPSYLNIADIGLAPFLVNPQHDSGVANKIYQYMYGSLPILATACKAQKELIESSNCGFIYDDFISFKSNLASLLNQPNLRHNMGRNGKKRLNQLYDDKVDEKFLKLYD